MNSQTNKINIVFVISNLEYGGAQRQLVELVNSMDSEKFNIHVCSLSSYIPLADKLSISNSHIHVLQKRFKFDISLVFRLAKLLRAVRADIIQAYLYDAEITARLAGWIAGTTLVAGSERNTDYRLKQKQMLVYHLTKPLRDICIANSRSGRDFNQKLLHYPDKHYFVIHNGVNTERFKPIDTCQSRKLIGIELEPFYIGMFGSFKMQKNHPLLFKAAKEVIKKHNNVRFLLVGDQLHGGLHGSSDYKKQMENLIDSLGIRDYCISLGNRDDVELAYNACDITVLPSLFEGTPNVILESMACGVPVIATDVSDNSMIIPDGKTGFIVPLGNQNILAEKIIELIENNELRKSFAETARDWVEKEFSTTSLAKKTETVYLQQLKCSS